MTRLLLVILTSILVVPTMHVQNPQESVLPKPSDYTLFGSTCKGRPWKLKAHALGRRVVFGKTVRCELLVHTCEGLKIYRSGVRDSKPDVCADYYHTATELNRIEVCCDEKDPSKPAVSDCQPKDEYVKPWFDPSAPGCQQLQDTEFRGTYSDGKCTMTLRACGYELLRSVETMSDPTKCNRRESYIGYWGGEATTVLPQKVCCDIFAEAARAGGCNPAKDADCDGDANDVDDYLHIDFPFVAPIEDMPMPPSVDLKNFDPRPPGLGWEEVMPNETCAKCKWVAVGAKLTCSPDKVKDHEYKVTWRCPSTGVERVVTKRAPATAPCSAQRSAAD